MFLSAILLAIIVQRLDICQNLRDVRDSVSDVLYILCQHPYELEAVQGLRT